MSHEALNLLTLPYDIRHVIYKHLFPPIRQIYILADNDTLTLMNHHHIVHTSILRVNRVLYEESAEFLYNNYLFNIVGLKQDCLKLYQPFLKTFTTHARQSPQIHAFSNGEHSATSCLSIQAGDSQLSTLQSRRRGRPRTIEELQKEVSATSKSHNNAFSMLLVLAQFEWYTRVHFLVTAVIVVLLSIVLTTLVA